MIRINLLPSDFYLLAAKRQLTALFYILGVFFLLAVFGAGGYLYTEKVNVEHEKAKAEEELNKYQPIVEQVKALETKKTNLTTQLGVIKRLVGGGLVYPKFFDDFLALMPSDVWVSGMNTTTDPSGRIALSVSAQALSNFAIADWLTNLQTSPLISDVKLSAISGSEDAEGRAQTLSFSLTMNYYRKES
jgi:Tfp pilus assembly protein PilN